MKKLKEILGSLLLSSLLILTSCGEKSAKVSADLEVTSSMAIEGLNMKGGAVIAGETTDQVYSFVRTFLPGEDFTVIMEQGVWNFSIITYSGEEGMLSGNTECGYLEKVTIDEDTDAVKVEINSDSCSKAGLRAFKLRSCSSSSYENVKAGVLDATYCGGGDGGDSDFLSSLRVTYLDHSNMEKQGDSIKSRCLSKDEFEDYNIRFLSGEGAIKKVLSQFELYKSNDCTGRSRTVVFDPSMANVDMPLRLTYIAKGDALRAAVMFNTEGTILNMENLNTAPTLHTAYQHRLKAKEVTISTTKGPDHFSDPNGDEMTFSCYFDYIINDDLDMVDTVHKNCEEMSGSGSFDSTTGRLIWAFAADAEDSYEITIKASDGQETTDTHFTINLMSEDDTINPNLDGLAVWLQAKKSYLYEDDEQTGIVAEGGKPVKWRNKIPNGSDSHTYATTTNTQAPTLETSSLMPTGELALTFNSSDKTFFSFPDGDYDVGGEGTIIVYASSTNIGSGSVTLLAKQGLSSGLRTYSIYQNTNQFLQSTIDDADGIERDLGATDLSIADKSFCAAVRASAINNHGAIYTYLSSPLSSLFNDFAGLYNSNGPLLLGTYSQTVGSWNGSIAEVLIWNRALDADETAEECTRLRTIYGESP